MDVLSEVFRYNIDLPHSPKEVHYCPTSQGLLVLTLCMPCRFFNFYLLKLAKNYCFDLTFCWYI